MVIAEIRLEPTPELLKVPDHPVAPSCRPSAGAPAIDMGEEKP